MIPTTTIHADDKTVTIKLMDESWLINQCTGAHPFKPRPGVVWKAHERCARLPEVAGHEFPNVLRRLRDTYGNCAAIAWHGGHVLGHLVWMPRHEARTLRAKGCEFFGPVAGDGPEAGDAGTLVVVNLAFCSLSGHGFRRKGVGRAMVDMMVAWAWEHGWRRIEAYDVTGGLFPWDWLDACIPPRPFWERMGFAVFGQRLRAYTEEELASDVIRGVIVESLNPERPPFVGTPHSYGRTHPYNPSIRVIPLGLLRIRRNGKIPFLVVTTRTGVSR